MAAGFVSSEADRGVAAAIARRAAAICYARKLAGCGTPTDAEAVKCVVRGIRRTIGAAYAKKTAATADLLARMLAGCPNMLRGKRDRALRALGFAGAFRRSERAALTVADGSGTELGVRRQLAIPLSGQVRSGGASADGGGEVDGLGRGEATRR